MQTHKAPFPASFEDNDSPIPHPPDLHKEKITLLEWRWGLDMPHVP